MTHFMEESVRENDYVLILCTQTYKTKSENRIGGVGYEGDIMTAEVLQHSNHRKFIPILVTGTKESAIPSWLSGKYFIDLSNSANYDRNFDDLTTTIFNVRESSPVLGTFRNTVVSKLVEVVPSDEDIKINGILIDEVSIPLNDGSPGSGLYRIPFELNKRPDSDWIQIFIQSWNRPRIFTQMHRPGIASVIGRKVILNGTTIEEVERYHKETLKIAVEMANEVIRSYKIRLLEEQDAEKSREDEHRRKINEIGGRITF